MDRSTVLGKRSRATTTSFLPSKAALLSSFFASPTAFSHHSKLSHHKSCVNALAVSSGDGKWLASGGDDREIALWNAYGDLTQITPSALFKGHRSNIFTLSFASCSTRLYSGGNDSMVLQYDVETGQSTSLKPKSPLEVWLDHDASLKSVAAHPFERDLFLTASDDGTMRLFDVRAPTATSILSQDCEQHDVQWAPPTLDGGGGNLFASCDGDGRVLAFDRRMSWREVGDGSMASDKAIKSFHGGMFRYDFGSTPATTTAKVAHPSCTSLLITPAGHLITLPSKASPVLYSFTGTDEFPIATFSAESTFTSKCTTKHGGVRSVDGKEYFVSGGDGGEVRIWEVPKVASIKERRNLKMVVDSEEGNMSDNGPYIFYGHSLHAINKDDIGQQYLLPSPSPSSSPPIAHKSIVNTCLFHPVLPLIFTSGIESAVYAHSSTPLRKEEEGGGDSEESRKRKKWTSREMLQMTLGGRTLDGEEEQEQEAEVLRYFDALLEDERGLWSESDSERGGYGEESDSGDYEEQSEEGSNNEVEDG